MAQQSTISSVYQTPNAAKFDLKLEKKRRLEQIKRTGARQAKREIEHLKPGVAAGSAREWNSSNPRGGDKTVRANFFRDHPTKSEEIVARALNLEPRLGMRPSVHLFGYIADFYSERFKLAVELDGRFHSGRREYDQARDKHLERRGIKTLRFPSAMAFSNLERIISTIRAYAESQVTASVAVASGEPAVLGTQDVNRKRPAGFETVNNGSMSGSAKPVA